MRKITAAALVMSLSVSIFAGRADIYMEECDGGMGEMCIMAAQFLEHEKKPDEAQKYYKKALNIMKEECDNGDASSCDNMGDFYVKGLGVTKSKSEAKKAYKKSAKLFKDSCDKGDKDSCGMLEFVDKKLEKL